MHDGVSIVNFTSNFGIFFNMLLNCLSKISEWFATNILGIVIISMIVIYFFSTVLERLLNK